MADNDALITQFMDVTGVQRDRAEFFLQSANFQLDVNFCLIIVDCFVFFTQKIFNCVLGCIVKFL